MKYFIIILFVVMIIAQWFVPISMIVGQENVLSDGKVFKFKTEPIDPSDPFRGKYIILRFAGTTFESDSTEHFQPAEEVFVEVAEDEGGYARIHSVTREQPKHTQHYFKAKVGYPISNTQVEIEYPFSRFYLEESKASEAEQAYWEANRDTTQVAYALVAVKNGNAALKDVMINNKSVVDVVNELNKE